MAFMPRILPSPAGKVTPPRVPGRIRPWLPPCFGLPESAVRECGAARRGTDAAASRHSSARRRGGRSRLLPLAIPSSSAPRLAFLPRIREPVFADAVFPRREEPGVPRVRLLRLPGGSAGLTPRRTRPRGPLRGVRLLAVRSSPPPLPDRPRGGRARHRRGRRSPRRRRAPPARPALLPRTGAASCDHSRSHVPPGAARAARSSPRALARIGRRSRSGRGRAGSIHAAAAMRDDARRRCGPACGLARHGGVHPATSAAAVCRGSAAHGKQIINKLDQPFG